MGTAIESGIGTINYGRQTAKGTKATAATITVGYNRPKWSDGLLKPGKVLAQQEYIDGQRFASPSVYADRVGGEVGELTFHAQAENTGLYFTQILGVDTTTGAADPYTHTITSAGTSGTWGTWWQKVGSAIGPERQMYWDSKIAKLDWNVGREGDDMVAKMVLAIQSLTAAEVFTTDAAKTEDASDPWLWTEVTGACSFDATVDTDANGEMLTIETGMTPYYGDALAPAQLIEGKGSIVRTVKSIVTDTTLAKFRKAVYNNTSPSAGDKPVKDVFYAAISTLYTRSVTRTLSISTPRVAVSPEDMQVAALPQGGEQAIEFGGSCLKNGATAALTVVALSADATTYA